MPGSKDLKLLGEDDLAAWKGLLRTHRDLIARLDSELDRTHGLPLSSYEVLMILFDSPGGRARMGEIASELLLSRSGLTRLVDRLQRQGFVSREPCPDDARGLYAAITAEGRAMVRQARPDHLDGVRKHFLSRLTAADKAALASAWKALRTGD